MLVADELLSRGRAVIGCTAAVLIAGDLSRRGLRTTGGRLRFGAPDGGIRDATATAAVLPTAGGPAGIGVAAAGGDPAGRKAARTVLNTWLSVAGRRTILLASPRSFCAGVERAIEIVERALDLRGGPVYVRRQIVRDPARVSYLTQTTLAVDETAEVVDALHRRFPAVRGPGSGDICYATTDRQRALTAIAAESGLMLVVGSANSSNSRRLVELARRHDTPAHLIDGPADICAEWLAGVRVVGLTAGASAPPRLVDAVIDALGGLGAIIVTERETTRETVQFGLPPQVRPS